MTLSPKIIKQLIDKEIEWCEANRTPGEEIYQDGFIAGLKQALLLIKSKPVVRFDLSASTVAAWLHLGVEYETTTVKKAKGKTVSITKMKKLKKKL